MNKEISEKVAKFFSNYRQQSFKKGDFLIRANENPSGVFYLSKGTVRVYAISKNGDELVVNIFKPFSFFPMNWAINNTENSYYYEAMSPVIVQKASRDDVLQFVKENNDILLNLLSRVYRGIDGVLNKMTYLMVGSAYARIIAELLVNVKRFGEISQSKKGSSGQMQISERDLAAQAGLTRETVSRELKRLKDKQLILFSQNTLTITNIEKLEQELSDVF